MEHAETAVDARLAYTCCRIMIDNPTVGALAIAAVLAYFLGSLPTAYVAGRLYGKNIFAVGSRQAGATNVFREVSHSAGVAVTIIDSAKGLLGIVVARMLGLDGVWLMLPASAVILGHWNSPFTRFRGGDGVSSFTGVALGLTPVATAVSFFVAVLISLRFNSRLEHPSLWGAVGGYATYLVVLLSGWIIIDSFVVLGIAGLGIAILLHSMTYRYRNVGPREAEPVAAEPELDPVKRRSP